LADTHFLAEFVGAGSGRHEHALHELAFEGFRMLSHVGSLFSARAADSPLTRLGRCDNFSDTEGKSGIKQEIAGKALTK
jgi:hypothetical protein